MIKAIVFDVGGVLVQGKSADIYRKLAEELGVDYEELMKFRVTYLSRLKTGETSAKRFGAMVNLRFRMNQDVLKKWKKACKEATKIDEEILETADAIRKNYLTAAISNKDDMFLMVTSERKLYSHFDVAINSCEVGFAKPQKEIFQVALKKLKVDADECVYIDDKADLLETPKEMGFKTIWFKNKRQLVHELKEFGIVF